MNENDWKNFQKSEELHQFTDDPEDDPYRSKYQGRIILQELLKKLETLPVDLEPNSSDDDDIIVKKSALCCILYKLAINYVDCDERPEGETTVLKILKTLAEPDTADLKLNPKTVSVYIAAKNYLGYIYCDRGDNENSLHHLCESESVYEEYKKRNDVVHYPWELTEALRLLTGTNVDATNYETQCWISFEKLHTYTLFYLAKLYKNLNEFAKSASYCQKTLERQYEFKDYDPIEWVLNAATLSQYYIGKAGGENFPQARHCLAAASAVIDLHEANSSFLAAILDSDSQARNKEKIAHCKADLYRCSAKYGLALLECSRERFLARDLPMSNVNSESESDSSTGIAESHRNVFIMDDIAKYEKEIAARPATSFVEAREIFLKVQHWLNKAKEYFVFDDYATDYVEIACDTSRAFKFLAFFETDLDRKCKMHKRRMDVLDACLKELNPQFYIQLCRQLTFELAEICNEIMDLKIDIVEERTGGQPNVHQISKINMLAEQGIRYFGMFLDSFIDAHGNTPTKYERNVVRPVCLAHFYMGRLYNKILTADRQIKLANCQRTLENYQWFVNYCDNIDPSVLDLMRSEYDVCKEMVNLYPIKIARIREGYPA